MSSNSSSSLMHPSIAWSLASAMAVARSAASNAISSSYCARCSSFFRCSSASFNRRMRSFSAINLSNSACFLAAATSAKAFLLAELDDEARDAEERRDPRETCDILSHERLLAACAMAWCARSNLLYSLVNLASSLKSPHRSCWYSSVSWFSVSL